MSRLRTIHVVIIGSLACVIVVAGLYFLVIKKSNERIAALQGQYNQYLQTWNQKATVEAQLEKARQDFILVSAEYERYNHEKMPPISFQDRTEGMIALWKEYAEVLGPLIYRWPAKTGVFLDGAIGVPPPPVVNPNSPILSSDIITIDLGTFKVRGDFRTILRHIKSWNRFNRLVEIGPLNLTGPTSDDPRMTGEYTVKVYIFPTGQAGPMVNMAGQEGTSGMPGATPMPTPGGTAPVSGDIGMPGGPRA
jgi:hypothetical protein